MKEFCFRRFIHIVALVLTMAIVIACSKKNNNPDFDSAYHAEDIVTHVADSVPDEKNEPQEDEDSEEPVWGTNSFSSAQDAIDYMNSSADASKYSAGIFHHMAGENLPYLTKLLNSPYKRFIVVDKDIMRVTLFDKYGREQLSYGMACAKNYGTKHRKADSRTPEGFFSAEGVYNSTDWLFTNDDGYTSPAKGQFGPRFIRVKTPVTTQIGIHGTAAPGSIGRRCSHGCIRVKNENIMELVKYVEIGMPIIITPGKRDKQVNESEGVYITSITSDIEGRYARSSASTPKPKKQTVEEPKVISGDSIKNDSAPREITEPTESQTVEEETTSLE